MGSTHGAEETHARSPQHAQTTLCHRGCHGRDISALSRGRPSSQMAPICRAASLTRSSLASVAATSSFGACGAAPRPRQNRAPPPASVTPSDSESSGREVSLLASELSESTVESHAPVTLRRRRIQQYRHLVRGRVPSVRVAATSGFGASFLAPPRAGHELQIECVRREPLVGQSPIKVPRAYVQGNPGSARGAASSQPRLDDRMQLATCGSRCSVRQCSISYGTGTRRTKFSFSPLVS